ncbi:MAG: efflux RND transporter periplasmic adaptor subunit [Candidatus Eisenbacteria bacterium]|nr:efflux RND transporter periplasmic adaptor subunit [Candidatus Eisenbacteria bacterium]
MKKLYFIIIPVLIILAGLFYLRERRLANTDQPAYETARVESGSIEVKVLSTGTIEPYTRVEVSSSVSGRIDKVEVNEGDRVKEGDILAWISSEDRIALLDAARSALESAQEKNDEEAIKQAKEASEIADKAYKLVPLTNSIRGEVIMRSCEPGQNVTTATVLFAIADRLVASVQVDEADIGKIKVKQKAWVVLDAFPDERVNARVTKISREGTLVSGVVEYDVMVEPVQVPGDWASGMTANVEFVVASKDSILVIPKGAVSEENGDSFVTVLEDRPIRRSVKTGITDGKTIEITEGLRAGDTVVLSETVTTGSTPSSTQTTSSRPRIPMFMGRR